MATIEPGRMTHVYEGELVVFLIGMQINRYWRPDRWLPTFLAMPGMLAELSRDTDSGFLGYRLTFGLRGPWLVQYWSSIDKLYAYASDQQASHRPAWAAFNRRARRSPGVVGVWHETYLVERAESIYVDTPRMGLGKAAALVPVTRRIAAAPDRLKGVTANSHHS